MSQARANTALKSALSRYLRMMLQQHPRPSVAAGVSRRRAQQLVARALPQPPAEVGAAANSSRNSTAQCSTSAVECEQQPRQQHRLLYTVGAAPATQAGSPIQELTQLAADNPVTALITGLVATGLAVFGATKLFDSGSRTYAGRFTDPV
jgi:hypothetical protein